MSEKRFLADCQELIDKSYEHSQKFSDCLGRLCSLIEKHESIDWHNLCGAFTPNIVTIKSKHAVSGEWLIDDTIYDKSEIDINNPLHRILKNCLCYRLEFEPDGPVYSSVHCDSFMDDIFNLIHTYKQSIENKSINYYDPEYRKLRHQVFLRDGEKCAKCGAVPAPGISLTIDHIKPTSLHPNLFTEIDNMQVLCWDCNKEKSNKHSTDYRERNSDNKSS